MSAQHDQITAEITKFEQEVKVLEKTLRTTPAHDKRLLSDTRDRLQHVSERLKQLRQDLGNTPDAILGRKREQLKSLRARLAALPSDNKILLGNARSEIRDVETHVEELERSLRSSGSTARPEPVRMAQRR